MNEICLSCKKHTKCGRAIHETIGCGYYVPQTNEEWFCSLSTEEKAKVLNDIFWKCLNYVDEHELVDDDISEIYLRWLKEKHK